MGKYVFRLSIYLQQPKHNKSLRRCGGRQQPKQVKLQVCLRLADTIPIQALHKVVGIWSPIYNLSKEIRVSHDCLC